MYNRCPLCEGFLDFHGISIRPSWMKWQWCRVDETYAACNENGTLLLVTKKIPLEAYFVTFREDRPKKGAA